MVGKMKDYKKKICFKKIKISLIKDKAKQYIPNGISCALCPFFQKRKPSRKKLKEFNEIWNDGEPILYEWVVETNISRNSFKHQLQYCSYLHQVLTIQDRMKQCGINNKNSND